MKKTTKEIVEYEEVVAKNPTSGALEVIKIEKPALQTPEQAAERVKEELKKYGLEPVSQVSVEDPITGEKRLITLDRTGHNEASLIMTLADPNLTRDRKDYAISMYLYERGAHNTSMIVDLMRYKGAHTKETRVFKSQIRYDFEAFVGSFTQYLQDQMLILGACLDIDIVQERANYLSYINEMAEFEKKEAAKENRSPVKKSYTYHDYMTFKGIMKEMPPAIVRHHATLVMLAMHAADEADVLRARVRQMADAREKDKGKGIYINTKGQPFTVEDPGLDEAIKADREITAEALKDND